MGREVHLVEIQWPSTASSFLGSGNHFPWPLSPAQAFCWVLVLLRFLSACSAQPSQSVPRLTLLFLPHPGICFSCFFFFLFLWTVNVNSILLMQGYFSVFSFSMEAFVNTRWQLNPGDLLLRPHLWSTPALLSWLRPCNRRCLCCGLPHPRLVPHCQGFLKYPDSFVCKFTVASVAGK